jgi:hypothetical protein
MEIVFFAHDASAFLNTAVTDIRRVIEAEADLLLVIWADCIAFVAKRTLPGTIDHFRAKLAIVAPDPLRAAVMRPIGCELIYILSMFPNFTRNSGSAFFESSGNFLDGYVDFKPVLDHHSFFVC